ncbi:recombinase family protein [Streptomyces sp. NPDC058272]|uniref:recombinase family protein n=1 Tax=Streptomyces sp. NPDC058272 TaxID=3346415 RepID=UPI0036E66877
MIAGLRGVRCIRLSVLTDETTSPDRQREADDRAARELGIVFDDREAEDLDVSASKTSPFERPQLGEWLRRPDEFDALVWWRFDRAIRSMADMYELAKWAREHRKLLVFAEGIGGGSTMTFDFRNPMDPIAEMMMVLFAFAAQVEAMSIRDRVLGAQAAIRQMPLRWRGSRPPYGYTPVKLEGGGWTLVPDTEAGDGCGPAPVTVIERIVRLLLERESPTSIAIKLNEQGIPSPRDYWSLKKGRATGGKSTGPKKTRIEERRERFLWSGGAITAMLRSEAMIGWKIHRNNPVRDSLGRPVMATNKSIMTRPEYDMIGAKLDERASNNGPRSDTDTWLLQVLFCAGCDGAMYLSKQGSRPGAYKCGARQRAQACKEPTTVKQEWAEGYVEREFLARVGRFRIVEIIETPGYDPEAELKATLAEFEEHQEEKGRQRSSAAKEAWRRRADALDARIAELEATPRVEPNRVEVPTDRMYVHEWGPLVDAPEEERQAVDTRARHLMLLNAGVRCVVKKGVSGGWRTLDESRMTFSMGYQNPDDPEAEALADLAYELASD